MNIIVMWLSWLAGIIMLTFVEYGILAPFLFSAADWLLVILGFVSVFIYMLIVLFSASAMIKYTRKKYLW